jgi:hypothetical protein
VDTDERLERLERRLRELEELVLDLRAALQAVTPRPRIRAEAEQSQQKPRPAAALPASTSRPLTPFAESVTVRPAPSATSAMGAEEWIGQRGLLAAGVFLLILAAGYFLKLAFDRGWISPLVRCAGGALFGLGVMTAGWRLHQRGLRTYGAAVMGAGAAIVYLAAWAAARLYHLLPVTLGLGGLAVVSLGVFALAALIDLEALALVATLGAFLAPVLLGWEGNPDALLIYAAFLAAGLGWFSIRRWRPTTFLVALSFFALGAWVDGAGAAVLLYAVAGSAAGLHVGLQRGWTETRVTAYWAGWILLALKGGAPALGVAVTVGGILLAAPIFWHAWRARCVAPETGDSNVSAETLQFYVTPLWLSGALPRFAPAWFNAHDGALALVIALPYLVAGYARPRIPFAMVGTTALGVAVVARWPGLTAVWALLGLALLYAALDHWLDRTDGRWYAIPWVGAAILHLVSADLDNRLMTDRAFTDPWALSLWGTIVAVAILAAGVWRRQPPGSVPALLWAAAATMLFLGVTAEIPRAVRQAGLAAATARLASGLAVSAWWAVFAALMVVLGFRLRLRAVRLAGLGVAGLAVVKVLAVDLAELSAFYRIGSVFTLALVTLGVAYLYHRQAKRRRESETTA